MPIYEYRCDKCGLEKEYLQKVSDAPISVCPCGESTMTKLVSAAGFQLKGTGWYVTDFKGGGSKPAAKKDAGGSTDSAASGDSASAGSCASGPCPACS
jgi:putative FmdB family regulatory protein